MFSWTHTENSTRRATSLTLFHADPAIPRSPIDILTATLPGREIE